MASWSGLWNGQYNENYAVLPNRIGPAHTALARTFAQEVYSRGALGKILSVLTGGNVGDNATLTHKRVTAAVAYITSLGGVRTIETVTDVNRATTAADITKLQAALALSPLPTYPVDKSGNGGGGKRGF